MTPAKRLLAAADLLDKRASEATGGPWEFDEGEGEPNNVYAPSRWLIAAAPYSLSGARDARYIATMHPEVGKALAAWLRHEGEGAAHGLGVINPVLQLADLVLAGEQQRVEG